MKTIDLAKEDAIFKKLSNEFKLSVEAILYQSIIAFLEKKIKEIQDSLSKISNKYGVKTIFEFEELYIQGKIEERRYLEYLSFYLFF